MCECATDKVTVQEKYIFIIVSNAFKVIKMVGISKITIEFMRGLRNGDYLISKEKRIDFAIILKFSMDGVISHSVYSTSHIFIFLSISCRKYCRKPTKCYIIKRTIVHTQQLHYSIGVILVGPLLRSYNIHIEANIKLL